MRVHNTIPLNIWSSLHPPAVPTSSRAAPIRSPTPPAPFLAAGVQQCANDSPAPLGSTPHHPVAYLLNFNLSVQAFEPHPSPTFSAPNPVPPLGCRHHQGRHHLCLPLWVLAARFHELLRQEVVDVMMWLTWCRCNGNSSVLGSNGVKCSYSQDDLEAIDPSRTTS
jgi:hypothetical protein